jgi:DNA-binding MarR family transcriptional regulator
LNPSALTPTLRTALGFHVTQLAVLFRRRLIRALDGWGVTPEQWQVMISIVEGGAELSQSEIAQLTSKDRHAVSKMIDRMQRDGWIARKPSSSDARAVAIAATAKAQRELPKMRATLQVSFKPVFDRMPAARRALLLELVQELIEALEQEE